MKTRGVIYDAGTVYGTGLISVSRQLAGTTMTVGGRYVRAGGDPDTEGYFDASG